MALIEVPGNLRPCRIAIFGEKPGIDELRKGKPFVGKTGKEVDRRLWDLRLDRLGVFLSNILVRREMGDISDPTPEEIKRDEPDLWNALSVVRPEIIVTMGAFATRYFLGPDSTLEKDHAIPRQMDFKYMYGLNHINTIIFPMYHTAAGFRSPDLQPFIEYDWQQFGGFLKGTMPPAPVDLYAGKEIYILAGRPEMDFIKLALEERPLLKPSIDTEGLHGSEWGLSLCLDPGTSFVLKRGMTPDSFFKELNDALRGRTIKLHNSLHDLSILRGLGITVDKFIDTMVMAYLLQVEPQGLKPLSYRHSGMTMDAYLDVVAPYAQEIYRGYLDIVSKVDWPKPVGRKMPLGKRLGNIIKDFDKGKIPDMMKRWGAIDDGVKDQIEGTIGMSFPEVGLECVPDEKAVPYSARDADATQRLYPALAPKITALDLDNVLALDLSVIPMVDRMQEVGMMVDKTHMKNLGFILDVEMEELKRQVRVLTVRPDFNPGSGNQIANFLFDDLKLEPLKWTKSKKRPSADDKALEELAIRYQDNTTATRFITLRGDYAEHQKLKGTYVDNLYRFTREDGRVHPNLRITRVVSGRLSANDPNLLAIPVRTQLGRLVRTGFVAPPGRLLGSWDLDQIEMRVLAHLSGDENMIEVLCDPTRHIHKETTYRTYGIPVDQVDKESIEYMMSKNISFGIVYGITSQGLRAQMAQRGKQTTEAECQSMINLYLNTLYPGVKDFMEKCRSDAARYGFVRSLSGRIRYLPGIHSSLPYLRSEAERAAGNFPIQAGATDIVKLWMREVWARLQGIAEPLLQVHDELIMEFDEGMELVVDYLMKEALEVAVHGLDLKVPIRCAGKWAHNWGALK